MKKVIDLKVFLLCILVIFILACFFCVNFFFQQRIIMCESAEKLPDGDVVVSYITTPEYEIHNTYIWGDKFKKTTDKVISRIKLQYVVNHMLDETKQFFNEKDEDVTIDKNVYVYHDGELGVFITNCLVNSDWYKIIINASNGEIIGKYFPIMSAQ